MKRILRNISCVLLLVTVLLLSLTACLKIGMKQGNVIDRLTKAGMQISYERTSPMTSGLSGYKIGDIVLAHTMVTEVVDGESVETEESLYVFFAQDVRSADAVENACKAYVAEHEELVHWNVYRYEEVVACGHYKMVNVVRQY